MHFEAALLAVLLAQEQSGPQTVSATLSVTLGNHARLSVSSTTMTFPDLSPDLAPQVPATPSSITITAKARTTRNGQVSVSVQATDDLRSGINTLPASLISWSADGAGFVPGALSASVAQLVGSWTGSGVRTGTQNYAFQNLWTHPPGTYSLTLIYTVSTP